jgi:hypothetical protein
LGRSQIFFHRFFNSPEAAIELTHPVLQNPPVQLFRVAAIGRKTEMVF